MYKLFQKRSQLLLNPTFKWHIWFKLYMCFSEVCWGTGPLWTVHGVCDKWYSSANMNISNKKSCHCVSAFNNKCGFLPQARWSSGPFTKWPPCPPHVHAPADAVVAADVCTSLLHAIVSYRNMLVHIQQFSNYQLVFKYCLNQYLSTI